MESQDTERTGGYWYAATVELDKNEPVRYRGYIILRGTPAIGELFLTTKRLIWIRLKFALPFARKLLEVPLGDIEGWSTEDAPWWSTRARRLVRLQTVSEGLDFVPMYSGEDANDWVEALETVFADTNILPRKGSP